MANRLGWPSWLAQAVTILGGAAGGFATAALGVPAGWLSGAMFATAVLAALGIAVPLSNHIRRVTFVGSGIAIGSAVTPAMLRGFAAYPGTLALMALSVAGATWSGTRLLSRLDGWSRETAFFASVPGALSYVFSVAAETPGADLPRIAVVQVMRVFLLMGLVPLLVAETGAPLIAPAPGPIDPLPVLLALLVFGAALGFVLERARVTAGMMFGAMIVAAVAHGTGIAPGRPPPAFTEAAQILIGVWVGARFVGFDWSLLGRSLVASFGSFLAAIAITALCAGAAAGVFDIPFAQALVAFSPGGLESMSLLSIALALDPLFVSAHHLARFILISATLPLALRRWVRPRPAMP